MRKLFAATALAVAMLPSAFLSHAQAAHYDWVGGCSAAGVDDAVAGEGQITGVMRVEMGVYSTDPMSNPVSATVNCYISVNGSPQPGASVSASGTMFVLGGGVISFTSNSTTDFIQICTTITFRGATGTETVSFCNDDFVRGDTGIVCAFLQQFAGTQIGDLWIGWDGDLWYGGFRVIDCPPRWNRRS